MAEQPKPKEHRSGLFYFGVIFLALVVLGMCLPFVVVWASPRIRSIQATQQARFEQPFLDQFPAYTGRFQFAPGLVKPRGKILVINLADKNIDALFYDLPRRNQAQTPDEVGALVWMDCRSQGNFAYLGSGWPQDVEWEACNVTLIDWPSKTIVASREFIGQRPPDEIAVGEDGYPVAGDQALLDAAAVNREEVEAWLLIEIEQD